MRDEVLFFLFKELNQLEYELINSVDRLHKIIEQMQQIQSWMLQTESALMPHLGPKGMVLKVLSRMATETVNVLKHDTVDMFYERLSRSHQEFFD